MTEIGGSVAEGFEPVRDAFAENFATRGEVGAAFAVYRGPECVVDLWGGVADSDGRLYSDGTLQMVASATKGAMAICVLRLIERGLIDPAAPLASYWPEFGVAGKERVTVADALSHRAGVPYLDEPLTLDMIASWDPAAEAVARQTPVWEPGTRHGYHAITHAWAIGELIRRVDGRTPGTFLADEIAKPLGIELFVGLPDSAHARVAPLRPFRRPQDTEVDAFTAHLTTPGSIAFRSFFIGDGLFSWLNDPRLWRAELPAGNGMGNAKALARMYAACLTDVDNVRLLQPDTITAACAPHAEGTDAVTQYQTRYGLGFQLPFPFRPMAGIGSFGHYGLGGSVGFADRKRDLGIGYTVNQMGAPTPADPRSIALIQAVTGCAENIS